MKPMDILVLFGGCSTEYGVSLESAHAVLSHMDPEKYRPIPVGITRDGAWYWYPGPLEAIPQDRWLESPACVPCTLRLDRGNCTLLLLDGSEQEIPFTAIFPVLHGKNGEDGTIQGLFELAGVPVIGCGALSSALCMDKVRSHQLAALAGAAVPKGSVVTRPYAPEALAEAARSIGYPLFVKPVRAGSSFGVTRLEGPEGLIPAVEGAFRHDREVLLEEAVPGFEVGCAVLGFGISVEVAPRVLMVPGEGIVQAIAVVTGRQFGNVKTAFDATLVSTALLLSLLFFHRLQGLGIGTIFSALAVGRFVDLYNRRLPLISRISALGART